MTTVTTVMLLSAGKIFVQLKLLSDEYQVRASCCDRILCQTALILSELPAKIDLIKYFIANS